MAEFLSGYRSLLGLPLLLAALLLGLASPALAVDPYDIYAILPLTGANAFVGNEQKTSFELLQANANRGGGVHGRSIRFIIYDSHSNPQSRCNSPDRFWRSTRH